MISEAYIREELKQVKDPEIPTISIVDLGIVTGVKIENKDVHVTLTPTFAGCPALRLMEDMVKDHLNANSMLGKITVETSSTISMEILESTKCPYCDSDNTSMKSPFGPTLCRSLHYCNNCKQAFEGFKPV
jgi:ring-1,2-phenylacetyl-CoA epoxidase subunit PaaD